MKMRLARLAVALVAVVVVIVWLAKPVSEPPETGHPAGGRPERRPNVLLVSLDTLRPDHLGCYGYAQRISPNLDKLAGSGVLFTNTRSQAPWTLPSHFSLFTSRIPSHNGVEDLNEVLSDDVPVLAEILRQHGYRTAGIVNDGQMKAHWGFSRGFDLWKEFPVDTPEGNCESITRQALGWLESNRDEPFFLFLHYFDAHEPYEAAEPFRQALGVTLGGERTREILWEARSPDARTLTDDAKDSVVRAYDAEIAWLDHEVGRLLHGLPPNTLVVVFSDHGEAFKEHGWTLHGATLYEEEVRVALLMGFPEGRYRGKRVEEPVMLLDVAPTILGCCGIEAPDAFEGLDLNRLLEGGGLPSRAVLSETKRVLEGRALKMVALPPFKLVYSMFDGAVELYRLPDEQKDVSKSDPEATKALFGILKDWVSEEDFLVVYAKGKGRYEATAQAPPGKLVLFIPVNFDMRRDSFDLLPDRQGIHWTVYPGERTKSVYMEFVQEAVELSLDMRISEEPRKEMVFLGTRKLNPTSMPFTVKVDPGAPAADPVLETAFEPDCDGFHVIRYRAAGKTGRPGKPGKLDEETVRQLRSLGYIR
jgi:hypothetical protein